MKTRFVGRMSVLGAVLLAAAGAQGQATGPAALSVEKIHAKPALLKAMEGAGKGLSLGRVTDAFDTQLMDRLNASRKFRVTAVSDQADLLKAVNRAGMATEVKALNFGLIATLDDFEDSTERMEFKSLNKVGLKRKVRLSVVAKIYNLAVDPPELYETANIQVMKKDDRTDSADLQKNAELTDEVLLTAVREASQQIADRVVNVAFPAKVLARADKQITINRGDTTGAEVGQVWNVMSQGKTLVDPDTGEVLGREEGIVGKARITAVQPKFSTAELTDGADKVTEGMVVRLPAAPKP
ncbi:MAG: hypothetical protein WCI17_10065 [bacterium]